MATAKHFAGHGPHEGGINTAPTAFAERLLRDQYLFPFEAAISETPVLAVMPSYNEMDGVPSHKNRWLLGRVLRQEWGFDGMVVSDYYAIDQMVSQHGVARIWPTRRGGPSRREWTSSCRTWRPTPSWPTS